MQTRPDAKGYAEIALRHAHFRQLDEGLFVGRVAGLKGVVTFGPTSRACEAELVSVVEDLVEFALERGLPLPAPDNQTLAD